MLFPRASGHGVVRFHSDDAAHRDRRNGLACHVTAHLAWRYADERGEGLLRALKLGSPIGGKIVEIARDLEPVGLLLNSPRPDLLRFMPALNLSTDEIDLMLSLLSEVIPLARKDA